MIDALAGQTIAAAAAAIGDTIRKQLANTESKVAHALVVGEGQFLVTEAIKAIGSNIKVVSLADEIGEMASVCGPAYAVAVLASEDFA